jgi:PKD repeat protein
VRAGARLTDPAWTLHPGRALRLSAVAAAVVTAFLAGASASSALLVRLKNGRSISYQPAPHARGATGPGSRASQPFDKFFSNLDYNGGPVMPSNINYALYWDPKGTPEYPADYRSGLNQFFEDLAHDSGGHENVDSIAGQYNDSAGDFASYSSHFGGELTDEDPYPANGCNRAPICLTDAQIRTELTKYVTAHGLPTDLNHEYFLLTPEGVEDCFEASGKACSANVTEGLSEVEEQYCAYHSSIALEGGGELIYSNDPFVNGQNCDEANHPNGTSDSALIGGLSHEHNESITDPEPNDAWANFAPGEEFGFENGDKCRTFVESIEFGTPLGTAPNGSRYNQVINGHLYWYQQEWSNQTHQCLQRFTLSGEEPHATFTSEPVKGTEMRFNATGSTAAAGVHYNWQFNDNAHSPGAPVETTSLTVTHKFPAQESFVVALTVLTADGTSIGTARTIAVGDEGPSAAFSFSPATPRPGETVKVDGSGSSDADGSIKSYSWNFGDGSAAATGEQQAHAYAAAGTYLVTLMVTDSTGQTASVSHTLTVGKSSQAITFTSTAPSNAVVGGPPYAVAAAASSGLPPSFSSATPPVCAVSGSTVSFIGTGACTIDANQAGNAQYDPAPQAQQSFAVGAKATATAASITLPPGPAFPPAPNSNFGVLSAKVNRKTGAITFTGSLAGAGTFSWLLTFKNGRFGVLASSNTSCAKGFIWLRRRCRPARIVFARGSQPVGSGGTVSVTAKPTRPAVSALRRALRQKRGLPVLAVFSFRSSAGGAPAPHSQALIVRLTRS